MLGAYFSTMARVVEEWGGTVEKFIGDAIMAVFGVPTVREDDASRALRAALAMGERLAELNRELARDHNVTLEIRTGVNTGEVVAPVGDVPTQRIVAGDAVNVAARLEQVAEPGTILVGERTHAATRGGFEFDPPMQVTLKGKPEPIRAFRLRGARSESARGIPGLKAPMIGRDAELATLLAALDEAIDSGHPRLVVVYGPAGIGKSRLAAEFVDAAQERIAGLRFLRGRCLAAGQGITYWALAEILRGAFGIGLDDPADVVGDRLRTGVAEVLAPLGLERDEVERTARALATTIGVRFEGDAYRVSADELARAWPRFATGFAAAAPAIWLIEDLHWAGDPALEMIERLAARTAGPLVLLATARPEFVEAHPGFGAAGGTPPTSISLRPLTDQQGAQLVERLLAVAELPERLRSDILAKAEGNPFFVEEILRRLIDEGVLVQDGEHWRATAEAVTARIPDTIYGLLAARVDALEPRERRIAQEAAVIGRTFWAAAVEQAVPDDGVAQSLAVLEQKGLITVRPTSSFSGHEEYAFRHALVRDVAYGSLPKARRARAHAEAAAWISDLAGERTDEFAELIAHHLELAIAGEDADLAWLADPVERESVRVRAVAALLAAGRAARRRYAIGRAVELHERAVELSATDAERADAYEQLGRDHDAAFHGEDALAAYRSAMQLARDDPAASDRVARLARLLGTLIAVRGGAFRDMPDLEEVDHLIAEGLAAATDPRERAALLMAAAVMAIRWSVQGQPDPVPVEQRLAAAREADAIANDLGDPTLAFEVADVLADLYALMGDVRLALRTINTVLPLIERMRSPARKAGALFEAAQSLVNGGQPARGLELAQQSLDLAANLSAHDQMHATSVIITAADWLGDWDLVETALAGHLANFEGESAVRCLNVQSGPNRGALVVARRGDVERARSLARRPIPFEATPGPIQSTAAEVLVAAGLPEEGLATARDVLERSARWRQPIAAGAAIHAYEALEDWDTLGRFAADLDDLRPASPYLDALIDRAAGRSMLAQGDRNAGLRLLRRALEKFERIPVVFEAAMTREALAAAIPDERERHLRAALSTYEALRAVPSVLRVRDLLATP